MVDYLVPSIITILGVLYIISPIDILPDFIPGIGWLDDIFVLLVITFTWMVTLGIAALEALMPVIKLMLVVVACIVGLSMVLKIKRKRK